MAWRGSAITVPGLLSDFVGVIQQVYSFDAANTLTKVTWRVTDAPSGGVVTIRMHDQADGLGEYVEATIADGETFVTKTESIGTGAGLWQEITVAGGAAMNLSGEYEMITGEGISVYFTTLALVKNDGKLAGTDADRDTLLNQLIAGVTREMQEYMGRDIVQGSQVDEKLDGSGTDTVYARSYPVIAVDSLTLDGGALVADTDFEFGEQDQASGALVRISGGYPIAWNRGRRNVVFTYDHGYVNVPADLVSAATAAALWRFADSRRSGEGRRGLDNLGVDPASASAFDRDLWTRQVLPVCNRYRRVLS